MKKEVKLINKVKRLIKRLNYPRWLHHFGPKIYEFYEHLTALLVRYNCRLSFRRTVYFLNLLGIRCPSKSALQYTSKRLSTAFWNKALKITSDSKHEIVAIDSTGFTRTNPSYHYLWRINAKPPKIPIKLSAVCNVKTKKFCAAKVRVLPAHDIKDAKFLIKKSNSNIVVADKAYSAEALYKFAKENNILLMIPMKKNVKRGFYRKNMHKKFEEDVYYLRENIEAGFGSIKRRFGSSVSSKTARTIKSEIYGRLVCNNIFQMLLLRFRTEPLLICPKTLYTHYIIYFSVLR